MTTISTVIDGYTVDYTPENDNLLPDCHITKSGMTRGSTYYASLQVLLDFGVLSNEYDSEHTVNDTTIAKIEAWANKQGWAS